MRGRITSYRDAWIWPRTIGLRRLVQRCANRLGLEIVAYDAKNVPLLRRAELLRHDRIDTVLDVGANIGQFATELRRSGYEGRIVSFEPLRDAFEQLERVSADDENWTVVNAALGSRSGRQTMHRGGPNGACSSILDMLPAHEAIFPPSQYDGEEIVSVERLDDLFGRYVEPGDRVYLKIDVQGYEHEVLAGAATSLPHVHGLQVELSTIPLYDGSSLFPDLCQRIYGLGFVLASTELAQIDLSSSRVTQLDGIFLRHRDVRTTST